MQPEKTRLNKFIARFTNFSRRGADELIANGNVQVNGKGPTVGQLVSSQDIVTVNGERINGLATPELITVAFNKPRGYVCSRNGQGNRTIYELLPAELQALNSVGRLDKDSSGLLLLSNDGQLANSLTHPRYQKIKIYELTLDKPLLPLHQQMISDYGITLEDGISKLQIEKQGQSAKQLLVTMHEGRNRQIRRTFGVLGYEIIKLHRTVLGNYRLDDIAPGQFKLIAVDEAN